MIDSAHLNYIDAFRNIMKQHYTIEIFSANCPLCKHITDSIEIGKCEGCNQIVYDVNNMTEEIKQKMKVFDVKAVPTTIIDGKIKVVGIPDFPWICSEDLYGKLKKDYPLKP
jgi:hypothetical protein